MVIKVIFQALNNGASRNFIERQQNVSTAEYIHLYVILF